MWAILCAGWFVCFQARIVSCVVLRVGSGLEELPVLLGSVPVHVVPRTVPGTNLDEDARTI